MRSVALAYDGFRRERSDSIERVSTAHCNSLVRSCYLLSWWRNGYRLPWPSRSVRAVDGEGGLACARSAVESREFQSADARWHRGGDVAVAVPSTPSEVSLP